MDYVSFCKKFFVATSIPIDLLKGGNVEYSSLGELLSVKQEEHWDIFPPDQNPSFCGYSPDVEFGRVKIEGTDYDLILGPVFGVPVTEQIVRQFMRDALLPLEYREQLTEYLYSVPRIGHLQFFNYLALVHLCMNHKEVGPLDFYGEDDSDSKSRNERQLNNSIDNMENGNLHNTYHFEMELYQHISNGNVKKLQEFLLSNRIQINEGTMAHSPLRQAKNLFIGVVTKVGMMGAIPGGVDVEKTYQLMDFYAQECERLQTVDDINNLQYIMIMDFCQKAGETHVPSGVSKEVYQCMNFIRSHTNENISIDDVANHVHRSISYITKRFKEELDIHIGAYISRCKLEEAKSLLTYSDKSLAEISSYLCFSSQSYFQNTFKKQYGVTPMQYRKQSQQR